MARSKCSWWSGHCYHFLKETREISKCRNGKPTGLPDVHYWHYLCCVCSKLKSEEANYGW
jgi:hypothetical protein